MFATWRPTRAQLTQGLAEPVVVHLPALFPEHVAVGCGRVAMLFGGARAPRWSRSADAQHEVLPALCGPLLDLEGDFGEVGLRHVEQKGAFQSRGELDG
jgi:hypothetical protein